LSHLIEIILKKWKNLPGAVFVSIIKFRHVFSEHLLALLACHDYLRGLKDFVILLFSMAFSTIKPEFAALGADLDLGVQNMFAHLLNSN
jgi:hypothetical protein